MSGASSFPGFSLSLMRVQILGCSAGMAASTGGTTAGGGVNASVAGPAPGRRRELRRAGPRAPRRRAPRRWPEPPPGTLRLRRRRVVDDRSLRQRQRRLHCFRRGNRHGRRHGRWDGLDGRRVSDTLTAGTGFPGPASRRGVNSRLTAIDTETTKMRALLRSTTLRHRRGRTACGVLGCGADRRSRRR